MMTARKQATGLYVDRSCHEWIVRDPDGNFWMVPSTANGWEDRQPFEPNEETVLEPVPGHYIGMLGLPF